MLKLNIPSYKMIEIKNLIFDYNGTLAKDGLVKDITKNKLNKLSEKVNIYVLTADTFNNAKKNLKDTNVNLHIISKENGTNDKGDFIKELGNKDSIAIGNGNNDIEMIKNAELGICILGDEGCSTFTMINSDLVIKNIDDCLNLFINPKRLIATLRK
ncbi:MAG: haloacid dehalogenase [Firmicutes bacterium]|nr:haloacid dehalogenase [Bacillota bacterium]